LHPPFQSFQSFQHICPPFHHVLLLLVLLLVPEEGVVKRVLVPEGVLVKR
jgi:hypothetical protein